MGEVGFHGAVSEFKRRLIETVLHQFGGNRSQAARALGLQRTYLLRLIRELGVTAPPAYPRVHVLAAVPAARVPERLGDSGRQPSVAVSRDHGDGNQVDTTKTPGVK
jgi:hypothetical protein